MLYIIFKTYLIILGIFFIRSVVPRSKINELIDFFWKNIFLIIMLYFYYIIVIFLLVV